MGELVKDILGTILQMRTERGWTEYELAARSDLGQGTINAWYCQGRTPKLENLEKICHAFGITMSQLFAEDDEFGSLTAEQRQLVNLWTRLPDEHRAFVLELLKHMQLL